MKISVVIPAYNEEKLLPSTLAAVRAANRSWTDRGWDSEIIVCNNNSTDRTAEVAQAGGARVVFEPVNQIGRARNTGAAAATGNWIVFVDADSQPSGKLFAAAADAISSGKVLAGGTTMRVDAKAWDLRCMLQVWNLISRINGWMAGAFIFVETAAFRQLKGFSPDLFVGEELDLSNRLKALARSQDRKIVILRTAPMLTSARKTELYTRKELLQFLLRFMLRRKSTQTNRDACPVWYDGRR
jgi:glycosyltransferase involved in cell wall biosynthesis